MKFIVTPIFLMALQVGFSQITEKNWEKATFETTRDGKEIYQTIIEFKDVPLTKVQEVKLREAFGSKEEFIDLSVDVKTLTIYHYSSLDDSGVKAFVIPVANNFDLIKSNPITLAEMREIYSKTNSH